MRQDQLLKAPQTKRTDGRSEINEALEKTHWRALQNWRALQSITERSSKSSRAGIACIGCASLISKKNCLPKTLSSTRTVFQNGFFRTFSG
jgi:hypothetical protein